MRAALIASAGTVLALVLAPICWAIGVSMTAWAIGAGLVFVNRLAHFVVARIVRDASVTVVLGAMGFSMVFRALLTVLTLMFIGAQFGTSSDRAIGLDRPDLARAALVVFILGFTLDAGIEAIRRAAERDALIADDTARLAAQKSHQETTA